MSLLTFPDSDAKIHGPIISDWQSVRHYCVSQLRTVWQHMRNNLGLTEEARTFFVNGCLKTFHKVVSPGDIMMCLSTSCVYTVYQRLVYHCF